MSIKWILTLAAWYVAWSIISSVFSKKTPSVVKKELDKAKDSKEETISVLFNNFLETQKNFFEKAKEEIKSEDKKALIEEKKEKIISLFDEYKNEAIVFVRDLTSSDEEKVALSKTKIDKIYSEKKEKIIKITKDLPEIKDNILESFKDLKNKFKK